MEKRFQNSFFVEKHMNKLPMWKITIPGQKPTWNECATIKLKQFFAKKLPKQGKIDTKFIIVD